MKKYVALLCLFLILFTSCNNTQTNDEEILGGAEQVNNIVHFSKKFVCKERPQETPSPDELPEGKVEYDDEGTFKPKNQENLHSNLYFYTDFNYTGIKAIYEGDISNIAYENACEWVLTLYEAQKLSDPGKMKANIQHRYSLLSEDCKNYVEDKVIDNHVMLMYHIDDIQHCSLRHQGSSHKVSFLGYKTEYTDVNGNAYYGITAELWFDGYSYEKDRQIPHYISSRDMRIQFFVEILFDSNEKIVGWQEQYFKYSDSQKQTRFMISPKGIDREATCDYFEITLDNNSKGRQSVEVFSDKVGVLNFYKDLINILKDTPTEEFNKHTFDSLKTRCSDKLTGSLEIEQFFNEFIADIKKYNVDFEFSPLYLQKIDTIVSGPSVFRDSIYGDLYCFYAGGPVKTGSQEFNDKYGLRQDMFSFHAELYFVIENGKAFFIGAVLDNNYTYQDQMSYALQLSWQGIELPHEEQG